MLKREPILNVDETEVPRPARKRRRGTPEQSAYVDSGCELAPTCLDCPLPKCKYDDPHWRQRNDLKTRDARIVELRKAGFTVKEVAKEIGVSDRTAYRVLLREKRGERNTTRKEFAVHVEAVDRATVMSLEDLAKWRPVTEHAATEAPASRATS